MVHCVSLAPCALQIYDVICDSNRSTRALSTSKLFVHIRSQTLGGKYLVFFLELFPWLTNFAVCDSSLQDNSFTAVNSEL